jgi:hypothetical protein
MMENNKIAKIFISAIIEEEVIELDFANTRIICTKPEKNNSIGSRMSNFEFIAKIRTTNEDYKTVIIEIQTTLDSSNIIRFRQDTEFRYRNHKKTEIYCIYFLGDGLKVENVPVIVVNNNVAYTQATGERLDVQHEFFSIIRHKSWIIQIPCITQRRHNDLEKLLGIIFDQSKTFNGQLFLNIGDDDEAEDFPGKFRPIIRHLVAATQDSQISGNQKFEDYYLSDIRAIEAQKDYISRKR